MIQSSFIHIMVICIEWFSQSFTRIWFCGTHCDLVKFHPEWQVKLDCQVSFMSVCASLSLGSLEIDFVVPILKQLSMSQLNCHCHFVEILVETSTLSRPICDPIREKLEGPTKDRAAYWRCFAGSYWSKFHIEHAQNGATVQNIHMKQV